MTYTYFDSSVLVKAYLAEAESERVRDVLKEAYGNPPARRVFVSSIAYVEATSAVARAEAGRRVSNHEARRIVRELKRSFTGARSPYQVLNATREVTDRAALLAYQHRLRGFDAVHLATALELWDATPAGAGVVFAATDKRLAAAAAAEGLPLLDLG